MPFSVSLAPFLVQWCVYQIQLKKGAVRPVGSMLVWTSSEATTLHLGGRPAGLESPYQHGSYRLKDMWRMRE